MKDLSIIIPSYNTKDVTLRCLISLINQLSKEKQLTGEIIVIDNGSTDGSVKKIEELKKTWVDLILIKNKKNMGYSKANNQGLMIAKGKYILFLNSDVIIKKISFLDLKNYLDKNNQIGGLTIKVLLPNGKIDPASHRGFPTVWNSFCYYSQLEKIFGQVPLLNRFFGGYHLTYLDLDLIHEIDSPSGAFYLIQKTIVDRLNGFDEDFFMYGEDIDLSFRIKKLGYKIVYYPYYQVIHKKYVSGLGNSNKKLQQVIKKHFYQAMKIFYQKHYYPKNNWIINKIVYLSIFLKEKFL